MRTTKNFLCLGSCLDPSVPNESVVKAEVGAFTLKPGDIAVFSSFRTFACHRVLYKKRFGDMHWYYLSPDHGPPDGWIPAYRMEGRVVEVNGRAVTDDGFAVYFRLAWGRFRNFMYSVFWSRSWGKRLVAFLNQPVLD